MPRARRSLVPGALYHVYNRVSRGEHVFRDGAEAGRLLARIAKTKSRDDFLVLAYCVTSNHYLCAAAHKKCYAERPVMLSRPLGGA